MNGHYGSHTMQKHNRREWLTFMGAGLMMPAAPSERQGQPAPAPPGSAPAASLPLDQFQPKSMLHVPETRVPRPRFPVIDVHTHLTRSGRSPKGTEDMEAVSYTAPASDVIAAMDRKGIATMVNLTGGRGVRPRASRARLRSSVPRAVHHLHRAVVGESERARVSRVSGRADPAGTARRRARRQSPEDTRAVFARRWRERTPGRGRRFADLTRCGRRVRGSTSP